MTKEKMLTVWDLKKIFTKRRLFFLFDAIVIILSFYFLGHGLNIVWDNKLLHSIWGNPITERKFNTGSYFESHEDPFYANVVFYFETNETFCAYNPIHVRTVLIGNRLSKTAVAGILLQSSRFYPDKLDIYNLIPQTGLIELHEPNDPILVDLASQYPDALILEGEATVQWHLEGDYGWTIVNGTKDIIIQEEDFRGSPIIHISPVDVIIQIRNNQRMEALTFAALGLSILAIQPIVKSMVFQHITSRREKRAQTVSSLLICR